MAKKRDATYDRLIKVGLQDPFIRGIAGVVVIATAASIAISALGSGTKAIITIAIGAARINGHGVATTSTANARTGSPDRSHALPAMTIVTGMNTTA